MNKEGYRPRPGGEGPRDKRALPHEERKARALRKLRAPVDPNVVKVQQVQTKIVSGGLPSLVKKRK